MSVASTSFFTIYKLKTSCETNGSVGSRYAVTLHNLEKCSRGLLFSKAFQDFQGPRTKFQDFPGVENLILNILMTFQAP